MSSRSLHSGVDKTMLGAISSVPKAYCRKRKEIVFLLIVDGRGGILRLAMSRYCVNVWISQVVKSIFEIGLIKNKMSQAFWYISLLPLFLIGVGIMVILGLFVLPAPFMGMGSLALWIENRTKTKTERMSLLISVLIAFLVSLFLYWDEFVSTGIPPKHLLEMAFIFFGSVIMFFEVIKNLLKYKYNNEKR